MFNLVLRELEKFHELKATIRAENTNIKNNNAQVHTQPPPPSPDVEKNKTQLRKEIKQELQKNDILKSRRKIELKFEKLNSGFSPFLTKERIRGETYPNRTLI